MGAPVSGINPRMLVWARERAGKSLAEVARSLRKTPDAIESWERGTSAPTYPQLESLAYRAYKLPVALFFFPEPPGEPILEVSQAVARLVQEFSPERILLFGSRARGEDLTDSDFDLLVVLPHMENKHKALVAMLRAVADLPVDIDIIPTDPSEIARRGNLPGTVLHKALHEGVALYERQR